ncbi:MAG TPA: transglutaminaseTgpA domain-containing protein, partial [Solirubrobacteraceae bacterium]|nr:transglutaminaseTgpA domain-containing protein [Solirubrobacteraceae bacterium]
ALALYATVRWATLMTPAPMWRLVGLWALAVALAGAVPLVRPYGKVVALVLTVVLCLLAFPIAGLQWHSFIHLRIAVSARHIGDGLSGLPTALVPYTGPSQTIRLVIALGAAVLLLDAAIVLAFAPAAFGDGRRAAVALPLIALAVVPSTLVRPEFPYLQGLLLFGLLAAFIWGERIRRDAVGMALAVALLAGVVAALVAPQLDQHKAWLNYRAWTGSVTDVRADSFNWNQTYGPLHWPHSGHEVLSVNARTPDYWKAENLDMFNGYAWVLGAASEQPKLPPVSLAALTAWTQKVRVTVTGMKTNDVIAPGEVIGRPAQVPAGVEPGVDAGSWTSVRTLKSGASYEVTSYSPHPSADQLRQAGDGYPWFALSNDLTLTIPQTGAPPQEFTQVTFDPFHHRRNLANRPANGPSIARVLDASPYAGAYALAQHLAANAPTPYAFVESVLRYLSHGYTYNQSPPLSRYPLVNFLFKNKLGYCQQFSGSMALLLRMGGLPVRVAAGFTPGMRNGVHHQWLVSDIDAHAWVEVWFPQYGWVRFDPTPASAPARGGVTTPSQLRSLPGAVPGASGSPAAKAGSAPAATTAVHHGSGGGVSVLPIVAALAVVAAIALALRTLMRPARSTEVLLDELERAMARTGRPLGPGVTLAGLEHRYRESPAAAAYIRSLRMERYGGDGGRRGRRGRGALRQQLRRDLGLAGRLRALWALPPRFPARRAHQPGS